MDMGYKQEVTVGSLVILAIVLFIVGTTWLSGRSIGGDSEDYWKIQFRQAGNLKSSSAVRISGVAVGRVEQIRLVDVGNVLVSVSLPERIVPKVDATANIVSIGFVGDAVIELIPGDAPEPLPKDRIIIGTQAPGFTDLAQSLGDRADSVLLGAQAIVNQKTADELAETMQALQGTLRAAQRTMEIYSNPTKGPTAELTRTLATVQSLSTRLDSTLANPALARTLTRADTLTGNLAAMTGQLTSTGARLDTLLLRVNQGQGTLGKFATDSGLYRDVRELSQSMKRLVDELAKNPGKVPVTVRIF
ncbi:MAG: MCE family protein [Gemmatimonadales bacterium]|nr:MCE family protein [Gemmatimonadales bacterium]